MNLMNINQHCLLLTFISNVLTSSVALHVSVSALQQAIHCLEMRRSGNVLLEYYENFVKDYTGAKYLEKNALFYRLMAFYIEKRYGKKNIRFSKFLDKSLEFYRQIDPKHPQIEEIQEILKKR